MLTHYSNVTIIYSLSKQSPEFQATDPAGTGISDKGKVMIKVVELQKGFGVYLPYELKDNFKSVFKTAKWNPREKYWEVGPRAKKKLDEWIVTAKEVGVAIEAKKQAEEANADIETVKQELEQQKLDLLRDIENLKSVTVDDVLANLNAEIESLKRELAKQRELTKQLIDNNAEIKSAKAQIETIEQQLSVEKSSQEKLKQQSLDSVSKLININELKSIVRQMGQIMKRNERMPRSSNRHDFEEARAKICTMGNTLKEAGIGSRYIEYVLSVNFNRPDRDSVYDAPDISDIYKIEE